MNKWLEILLGIILIIAVSVFASYSTHWGSFWNFRHAAWEFFKGGLSWAIIGVGVLLIILGISDINN
jgi:hypothetical protein